MLLLVLPWDAEADASAEWWYLRRWLLGEARAVFGKVQVVPELPADPPDGTEATLVLRSCRVLIGRASLRRMREELTQGQSRGSAVYATNLTTTGPKAGADLFTLADFEQAEAAWLAGDRPNTGTQSSGEGSFPAALLCPEATARCASGERIPGPRAGLCYEFIDYYGGERADVLPLLPPDLGTESSVLEVGCGRGATAALIRERFGCRTVGIELNPEAALAAESRLDRVIRGDVQAVEPGETFDAIVAFELFEHLTDGQAFLERAAGWLRPGGRMVFSVPNVGHYSVVEDLIAGRWDYVPMGLLCATHVRFFTRRTLEDWLHAAGFDRYRIDAQVTPLPERIDALPDSLTPDRESLTTAGFYVSIFV
ncbi:MAG: class I SAM-dependent methyltransferase [Holophagales bacterium]|nr:class I SAM-dependent methyltransferase [Holophagales bacterium]MYG31136.1 class I SAM-dependent methyltransferase [Holophagales bacterium]MYI79405.1 class I SAM-dependent methyltransferase [Holophagales bacterium]